MRKILSAALLLLGAVSCVDDAYDLSDIDSDSVSIGTETSEFRLPVARITISAAKLGSDTNGQDSILDLYREADIWLPSTLPGGADAVEVERLSTDADYLQSLLDGVFDEMDISADKRTAVCKLIADKYRSPFVSALPDDIPAATRQEILTATPEQAAETIGELYTSYNRPTRQAISEIAETYLANMRLEPMEYDIPAPDLSSDVRDMLEGGGYLYGTIENELPFRMRISPRYCILSNPPVPLDIITTDLGTTEPIAEFELTGADFENFLSSGMTFRLETNVERYYPASGIRDDQSVFITLKLRKTGGLKL